MDPAKRFLSASNTKLYTSALALKVLGPEKTFRTLLDASGTVVDGTLQGSLMVMGGGDPSLTYDDLRGFAQQVAARGIKRVWSMSTDDSWFSGETFGDRYPDGWTLDDTLWYYGPQISALTINRNQTDIFIEGAAVSGQPAKVVFDPPLPEDMVQVEVATGGPELAKKTAEELIKYERGGSRDPVTGSIAIYGQVAPGQKLTEGLAIPDPPKWAGFLWHKALREAGIEVIGVPEWARREGSTMYTLLQHESAPLRVLVRRLLKNSDNLYAEVLLRDAGMAIELLSSDHPDSRRGAAARAHRTLFEFLRTAGIPTEGLRFTDGSGLSRYNLITPRATAQLLAAVERMPGGDAFWDAMPIGGVDGTLKNRMKNTAATNNARAKTGTFSIVSTLSGYVTTRDGHRLAVSLLTNFAPDGTAIRAWQDRVYSVLAEADWHPATGN